VFDLVCLLMGGSVLFLETASQKVSFGGEWGIFRSGACKLVHGGNEAMRSILAEKNLKYREHLCS